MCKLHNESSDFDDNFHYTNLVLSLARKSMGKSLVSRLIIHTHTHANNCDSVSLAITIIIAAKSHNGDDEFARQLSLEDQRDLLGARHQ